jgi:hypothetical protein
MLNEARPGSRITRFEGQPAPQLLHNVGRTGFPYRRGAGPTSTDAPGLPNLPPHVEDQLGTRTDLWSAAESIPYRYPETKIAPATRGEKRP